MKPNGSEVPEKDPAAVALGRKGGLKQGVKKGFAAMSPERRQEIAEQKARRRERAARIEEVGNKLIAATSPKEIARLKDELYTVITGKRAK